MIEGESEGVSSVCNCELIIVHRQFEQRHFCIDPLCHEFIVSINQHPSSVVLQALFENLGRLQPNSAQRLDRVDIDFA
jgi:hypothetical protein